MRWFLLFVLLSASLFPGFLASAADVSADDAARTTNREKKGAVLRVMTFNIRNSRARDGVNAWSHRRDFVADIIRDEQSDIIGMQECLPDQLADLEERLKDYEWYGVGREDGKQRGEVCAVFYRAERFKRLEAGEFWLSETPDEIASKSWDAAIERIVTRIVLRDERTGRKLGIYATHFDHRGVEARAKSAALILSRIRRESTEMPWIVLGDFNATVKSVPYRTLTEGMPGDAEDALVLRDARDVSKTKPVGPDSTWNGFREIIPGRRLDFIFLAGPIECRAHRILDVQREGRFPSDHLPVLAELTFAGIDVGSKSKHGDRPRGNEKFRSQKRCSSHRSKYCLTSERGALLMAVWTMRTMKSTNTSHFLSVPHLGCVCTPS